MKNDQLTRSNRLRWINFSHAKSIAKLKSAGPIPRYGVPPVFAPRVPQLPAYRVPQATQWIAGLVTSLELGDLRKPYEHFRDSYLRGVQEWVDTQYGLDTRARYILGPSETNPGRWLDHQNVDVPQPGAGAYGVRFIREPAK